MNQPPSQLMKLFEDPSQAWGVYWENLDTGQSFEHRSQEIFETASTIKLPILLALFDKVERGDLSFNQPVYVQRRHLGRNGSGLLQFLNLRKRFSLYNIAVLMIIVSDNIATNVLIELLGKEYLNDYFNGLRLTKTRLLTSRLNFADQGHYANERIGETTATEMGQLMRSLANGSLFNPRTTQQILKILSHQHYMYATRYLPTENNLGSLKKVKRVASKSGSFVWEGDNFQSTVCDVGLIETTSRHRYIFAIFFHGMGDRIHLYSVDSKVKHHFAAIGLELYNYFEEGK